MRVYLADSGRTRVGRTLRQALERHEVTAREPGDSLAETVATLPWQPDLTLFTPAQVNRLPADLAEAPFPTVLVLPSFRRDAFHLSEQAARAFHAVATDPVGCARFPNGTRCPTGYTGEPAAEALWDVVHAGPAWDRRPLAAAARVRGRMLFEAPAPEPARIALSTGDDPELHHDAPCAGSLLLVPRGDPVPGPGLEYAVDELPTILRRWLADEEGRAEGARRQARTLEPLPRAWDRFLEQLEPKPPGASGDWWSEQAWRSHRGDLDGALKRVQPDDPARTNLRGCLLAARADLEPDLDRQARLRDEARSLFQRARSLGRLVLLSEARLLLRDGQVDEAVTVLCEAAQDRPL
ncbi:MAG: hypothetical protein AB1758_05910, partial [Candidatus Eremiobacterota bacterium]